MYSQHICADIVYVQFDVLCISSYYVLNYVCSIHSIKNLPQTIKSVLGDRLFCKAKLVSQDRWSLVTGCAKTPCRYNYEYVHASLTT